MGNLELSRIRVEHMTEPIGLDVSEPRFSWVLQNTAENDVYQQSYRICIRKEEEIVADTGEIASDESIEVTVEGFQPEPKTSYTVLIYVTDDHGNTADGKTAFETGFMGTEWETFWYEPEQEPTEPSADYSADTGTDVTVAVSESGNEDRDFHEFRPSQFIRIPVHAEKEVKRARVYMTAHGIYRLYVNGVRPDDREFAPEITAYNGFLQYQTYDVTSMIAEGNNILGVILADGWWVGRVGLTGDCCQYGDKLGILVQTELLYEDGTREMFDARDGVSSVGPLVYSDLFVGERYDAGKELAGWDRPGFDDSDWKVLKKAAYSMDNLSGQYGEPVHPIRVLKPVEIIRSPKGEVILDAGQVLAGQLEASIDAPAGVEIRFEHSEVLDTEGNYYNNILGINKEQMDVYITKEGHQIYRPLFSYHGFRYVKISGWPGEPRLDDFRIYVLSSEMEDIGSFETSNEELNQLQHNIYWSQISNSVSLPTDCPQRERAGWTGDIMAFSPTMCFNRDADAFLTRWMKSVRIDQRPDGAVTDVVPYLPAYELMNKESGFHTSCGWGDAVIRVPLAAFTAYGDRRILADNFDAMEKWMAYIRDRCENHHPDGYEEWDDEHKERSKYLWNTDFHFGDWLVPSMVLGNSDGGAMIETAFRTMVYVAPAYYAFSARSMVEVAKALGMNSKAAEYEKLYETIRKAYIEEYIDENGLMPQELQGLYVIALKNDLVDDERRPKMAAHLRRMIEDNDNRLDTGFLSVLFLMDTLMENGMQDLAVKILYQNRCPSWLYMVEHGATTMWESWGAVLEDGSVSTYSYNHYAFGCVGDWLYRTLGGLTAIEAGYKHFKAAPSYEFGLTSASVSEITPYGKIEVSWKKDGNTVDLAVTVPVNTTADIEVGSGEYRRVGSGHYEFQINL